MENNKKVIEVLNDLIQINNDRIVGYERALKELKDDGSDLRTIFEGYIDQSRNIRNELGNEVQALKGKMDDGTTGSGKIYRAWMDVKAVFAGHDRHAVLENCEYGEDAAQKAYKSAISTEGLPAYILSIITKQQEDLRGAHDEVKSLRDAEVHA